MCHGTTAHATTYHCCLICIFLPLQTSFRFILIFIVEISIHRLTWIFVPFWNDSKFKTKLTKNTYLNSFIFEYHSRFNIRTIQIHSNFFFIYDVLEKLFSFSLYIILVNPSYSQCSRYNPIWKARKVSIKAEEIFPFVERYFCLDEQWI